ncbi:hypothetical protein SAMN04488100_10446 [Alkalibacterium putridalgicola]|uniref:PsbP protein n=1 Tax=Alkalibacterium putridalgicola TaxID=426703 RepID=A0A1H7RCP1_9LACT|nr:hypothetical protein [Alkalibacterium putridalgicola]GEK88816.1 hypothetical protein APU01nite_08550 [Alkalibacterium putridalgicola]SEL57859.1 hypothetical protein SAMN04488100_10446 [Alkalibacterium putridalgicola]
MSLKKKIIPLVFLVFALTLVGCGDDIPADTKAENTVQNDVVEESDSLYTNDERGISISPNMEWQFESESKSDNLNIVLKHNKLKAIVSSVSPTRSFEDIKKELMKGSGDVAVLSDEADYLSYQSKLKKAVRTDVYFREHNDEQNVIMIFMSSSENYQENQEKIESLVSHTELN